MTTRQKLEEKFTNTVREAYGTFGDSDKTFKRDASDKQLAQSIFSLERLIETRKQLRSEGRLYEITCETCGDKYMTGNQYQKCCFTCSELEVIRRQRQGS